MARKARAEFAPGRYHVTARGVNRCLTFIDDGDYEDYIRLLAEAVGKFGWVLLDFCLMPNHVHLLVETKTPNLGRGMGWLHGVYAQRFNRRRGRIGHLFQDRFKSPRVDDELYLVVVAAYIALNPVRARMVDEPGDWPWSGHGLVARGLRPKWLAHAQLRREVERATGRGDFLGPLIR